MIEMQEFHTRNPIGSSRIKDHKSLIRAWFSQFKAPNQVEDIIDYLDPFVRQFTEDVCKILNKECLNFVDASFKNERWELKFELKFKFLDFQDCADENDKYTRMVTALNQYAKPKIEQLKFWAFDYATLYIPADKKMKVMFADSNMSLDSFLNLLTELRGIA